jgi:GT2 family glycosyltransferase
LPAPIVTVVVATLAADDALANCLRSLEDQTFKRFEVIVVDNSGAGRAVHQSAAKNARVIANASNRGFGAAMNQGFQASDSPYLATLNDDAVAHPEWLEKLVMAAEKHTGAGMFASEVRLNADQLDSAGMRIAADGSSKQRGHGESPSKFSQSDYALLPSGSAALYRRQMLDEIGLFDESFFLYCEDTDLGLRGRRAGWDCVYVAGAIVEHRYSHSAGRASLLKAYYVERNRLYTAIKNLPFSMLLAAPFASLARYFWHLASLLERRGKAAEFRAAGSAASLLPFVVFRAHIAALFRLPRLWKKRQQIARSARLGSREFRDLLKRHSIALRRVAEL